MATNLKEKELETYRKRELEYSKLCQSQVQSFSEMHRQKMNEKHQFMASYQAALQAPPQQSNFGVAPSKYSFSVNDLMQAAEKKLTMVPIRIDVETDGVKWRDTFTWNLNEAIITPDQFAKALCDDVALTPLLIPLISAQIKEQLEDYRNHAPELIGTDETATRGNDSIDDGEKDLAELRIIIKLDITIDQQCINDQFEWDMACRRNNPELFADTLVSELGLYPEFKTAIAHSIREQIHSAKKSLLVANHDFGTGQIKDENVAAMFLPPLGSTVKRTAKEINEFGPFFSVASATEIEKMEKDLERETRRKRRQTARSRKVVTIEREIKTNRTPLPCPVRFIPDEYKPVKEPTPPPVDSGSESNYAPSETVETRYKACIHCRSPVSRANISQQYCNGCTVHIQRFGGLPPR